MKVTEEILLRINEITKYIFNNYPAYKDCNEDNEYLFFSDEVIKELIKDEEDIQEIELYHPNEYNVEPIAIEEYLDLDGEIQSLSLVNKGLIKTHLRRYFIVTASDSDENYLISNIADSTESKLDGITIKLKSNPLIVTLVESNMDFYDPDYYFQYLVIELKYESEEFILDQQDERKLIDSFLFEIADSIEIALNYSSLINPSRSFYDLEEELEEGLNSDLRKLIPYNEGMKLFISATQIKDPQMKFLNFYKILELFAPIAVNIDANELMRKKLDDSKSQFSDGDFIRSIYELAVSMKEKFNDEDLIKATITSCIDIIGLFELLPYSLTNRILKQLRLKRISYKIEHQKKTTMINMIGKAIYKTRNKVVHAKSNYSDTGYEINTEEFKELNNFMKRASSQAIRWYCRQPSHLKLNVI